METLVTSMIFESAARLGLDLDSETVLSAVETAKLALADGHGVEVSFDIARSVLIRATQPESVLSAA